MWDSGKESKFSRNGRVGNLCILSGQRVNKQRIYRGWGIKPCGSRTKKNSPAQTSTSQIIFNLSREESWLRRRVRRHRQEEWGDTDKKSEVTDKKSEVTDKKSEVTDKKSEVTDKKSEVTQTRRVRWHRQDEWGDTDKKSEVTQTRRVRWQTRRVRWHRQEEWGDTDKKSEVTDKKSEVTQTRRVRWHRQEEWGDRQEEWGDRQEEWGDTNKKSEVTDKKSEEIQTRRCGRVSKPNVKAPVLSLLTFPLIQVRVPTLFWVRIYFSKK